MEAYAMQFSIAVGCPGEEDALAVGRHLYRLRTRPANCLGRILLGIARNAMEQMFLLARVA